VKNEPLGKQGSRYRAIMGKTQAGKRYILELTYSSGTGKNFSKQVYMIIDHNGQGKGPESFFSVKICKKMVTKNINRVAGKDG